MGRHAKNQDPAQYKTRPISSYFFSSSRSATNPPPSPTPILGPSSQQIQPTPDETANNGSSNSTQVPISTTTAATTSTLFNTTVRDTSDSFLDDPFNDPFNPHDDNNSWETAREEDEDVETANATTTRASSEDSSSVDTSTADESRAEKVLKEIDGMELMASQVSSEFLRRLALSPRKPKRTLDLGFNGSPGSKPVLTFSEKLTAEMSRAAPGEKHIFAGGSNSSSPLKPKKLKVEPRTLKPVVKEDVEVQGSDSGSDADWDDNDVYVSAVSTPQDISKESEPAIDLSDDDIPTLSKFTSKKGPIELDDSDSDFGEDPFADMNTAPVTSTPPAAAPTPTAPPPAIVLPESASKDDVFDSDIELTQGEESDSDVGSSVSSRRPTRSGARPAARNAPAETTSKYGRTLRNTKPNPEPDFDIPVRRASKGNKVAKKPLFSLDFLLKEKERRERVGYDLQVIKNHIALDDEQLEEFDMNEEELQVIPEGILSEEQEAALKVIIKDTHSQTVEDISEFFIHWPQNLVVDPLDLHLTDADKVDHIVQRVLKHTQTEVQRHQFLTSPFLPILCSSPWTMPRSLFRWLVHVVGTEQNQPVTLSVFSIIQKVLSQRTSLLGVDHQDLVRIFCNYGAKEEYLDEEWQVAPVTSDTTPERTIDPETPEFPRHNLKAVIKLINLTATLDPQFYDNTEIRKITSLLLRMTTDPIIGDIKSLLGSTLAALLDAIPVHSWDAERDRICDETLNSLGTSAAFLLLTLHQLPSLSGRISLLRRSIALAYLKQPPIPAGQVAPNINELHRALFVDRELQALRQSDYLALGRRYQIYGFCMDDEQILAGYVRRDLEMVSKKLQIIHGRISDAKAAHLDRTRAKEYIQRIIVRLEMVLLQKETVQGTLGFGVQNNNNSSTNNSTESKPREA